MTVSAETIGQIVAVIVALALVARFAESHSFEFFYLLFLPVIWMAVRGGLEMVTLGVLLIQVGLILCVQLLPIRGADVASFQALMLVLTLSGLAAGAVVTEHRRAEAQLRRHQESLADVSRRGSMGELAAMVAHEINQPLMAAGTYARLVAEGLRSVKVSAPVFETAEKTVAQVQRAADVVRQLRALIRLDQSNRAPVAVERIVRETVELYRPELDRHGIVIRLALDLPLPLVLVDLLQIEQVLLNLVKNATEAISDARTGGGTITIAARRHSATHVLVLVQDTGPGFPAAVLGAELTLRPSKKADSLGIGLSLCRSIVESHGGELRISNAGGATAEFTLPAAEKD